MALAALKDQDFTAAVAGARAVVRVARDPKLPRRAETLKPILARLRRMLLEIASTGETLIPLLRQRLAMQDVQDSPEAAKVILGEVEKVFGWLREVVIGRDPLVKVYRPTKSYWPESLHLRLVEVWEQLDDLRETLALSSSHVFREEILADLAKAGVRLDQPDAR